MVSKGASIVLEQAAARPEASVLLRPSDNAVVVDDEDDDLVIVVVVVVVVVNNDDLDLEDAPPRGMISYSAGFFVRIMSLLMMSHDLEAAAKEEAARTTVFWGQKTENETRTSAAARRLILMVMVMVSDFGYGQKNGASVALGGGPLRCYLVTRGE
jgi:hypothetical protein